MGYSMFGLLLFLLILAAPFLIILRIYLIYVALKRVLALAMEWRGEVQRRTTALQKLVKAAGDEGAALGTTQRATIANDYRELQALLANRPQIPTDLSSMQMMLMKNMAEFNSMQALRQDAFDTQMASIQSDAAAMGLIL